MQMGSKSVVLLIVWLLLLAVVPTSRAAAAPLLQEQETEESLDIRDRIANFLTQFVEDDEAESAETPAVDEEEAPAIEIDPSIVSGAIAVVAIAIAGLLVVRGYQAPGKRDPFRSRW